MVFMGVFRSLLSTVVLEDFERGYVFDFLVFQIHEGEFLLVQ